MTDIEQKALALVREVLNERNLSDKRAVRREVSPYTEALCRAIEQHEAFRQEVSDAMVEYFGVQRLRSNRPIPTLPHEAADRIEQLEREKAVVSDLWEQQKEIALDYLADCNKAAERIEALIASNEQWQVDYNEGVLDNLQLQVDNARLREHLISALDTLKDAEICDDNCGPCNEARAALEARGFEIREKANDD